MSDHKQSLSFQDVSLERSFLWSLAITTLPVLSGFAISWIVARFAGAHVVGTVSWVMSFATAALIVGKFGLGLAASRQASDLGVRNPGALRELFRTAFQLRLIFTLSIAATAFAFAPLLAAFFNDPALTGPIRIGAGVVVGASVYEFKENFLIGLNCLRLVYRIRIIHLGLRIAVTAALVFLGFGATWILGGYCAAWLAGIAAYAFLLWRRLPRSPSHTHGKGIASRLLALGAPLAVSSASVTIYSHMDRLMLGYFSGVDKVGQYAVARNITEVSLFPVFAMTMMLRPALASRFSISGAREGARIVRGALRFSLVSGGLFAVVFALLGVPLVTLVFSASFSCAGGLMVFFTGVILLRSIGAVILPSLIAAERTRVYAYLTSLSAVLNFGLNLVLIPRYEARGAIVATVISYGVLLAFGLREVFVTYGVRVGWGGTSITVRTILASAGAVAFGRLIIGRFPGWSSVLTAIVLAVVYVALIFLFRVGNAADVRGLVSSLKAPNRQGIQA